jgi:hypothetical protein
MNIADLLQIDVEWVDPGGAKGTELRATWASLSVRIDGRSVTELYDTKTKSVRSAVSLPIFPLAEWIANSWWFLNSEVERPDSAGNREYDQRHNLRWAREGFVLPSLRFVPLGDHVAAEWHSFEIPDAGVRFLSEGKSLIPKALLEHKLRTLVDAVVARLAESGITDSSLQVHWREVENADEEEQDFCRAVARLGMDPYSIDKQLEERVIGVAGTIRPELLDDFLSLTKVDELEREARELEAATMRMKEDTDSIDALAELRRIAPNLAAHANPWDAGYLFANELRAALNGNGWKSRSLDELAGYLGVDQLDHCLMQTSGIGFLDALVGVNQLMMPKFFVNKHRPDSRQFAFCRALFEHLTVPPRSFAAVSRLRTERQQMNRAFAAEFLAPHEMLRNDLSGSAIGEDELDDLAADYCVSPLVIQHQIENHRLARVSR